MADGAEGYGLSLHQPEKVNNVAFRNTMATKYNVILRQTGATWNGMRISAHIFNTEADIDAALKAIGAELS